MKCWVLWVERNRGKLYKKGNYSGNSGEVRTGFFSKQGFSIPDKAHPIELELKRGKTVAFWIVDGRTSIALTSEEAEVDHEETLEIKRPDNPVPVKLGVPIYKKKVGSLAIYPVSDPTTFIKQNILMKGSFYDAIMKKLKVGIIATIIYMCAGGGLFLLGLYLIKIIFLKESTI
jgi:hypothetical protein